MTRSFLIPAALTAVIMLSGATAASPDATPAASSRNDAGSPASRDRLGPPRRSRPNPPRPSAAAVRVAIANHAATAEPDGQTFLNAVQVYPFADGMVYRVYTAPGLITDIVLQPGEALGSVAAGDTVRWVIGDTTSGSGNTKATHILVKPFAAELATNLVISTDRRIYHLSLTSTHRTAMTALSWTYPQDQLLALRKAADAAAAARPVATGVDLDRLHFNYAISGARPAWRPLRAFDDGRQVFIEFPPDLGSGVAPPLFVVGPKGAAELVNYRVNGRFYIVDRLFDAAELRFGLKRPVVVRLERQSGGAAKGRAS